MPYEATPLSYRDRTDASRIKAQSAFTLRREGLTYEALGRKLGVTRERARYLVWRTERLLLAERHLLNVDFSELIDG